MGYSSPIRRLARSGWSPGRAVLIAAMLTLALLIVSAFSGTPATAASRHAKLPPAVPSHINDTSPAGLDSFILTRMEAAHVPGLAACVVYKGHIVWAKGYGWANIEEGRRVTPDTDFMLASVSKTFVATAAMQQVEAGHLDLFADVNTYLPFSVRNPAHPNDPITLFQLLTHTSSIQDYRLWEYTYGSDSEIALRDYCAGYLLPGGAYYNERDYYSYAPGARCAYSNMGASLAALVVEEATETPFDSYCDDHIFAPLGMNQTSWKLAGLDPRTLAMPYRYGTGLYVPYGHYGYPDYPDGQLRTSVSQLGRFLALCMNGGSYRGVRLLEEATVTQMLTPQIGPLDPTQGLIWYWEGDLIGHSGGDKGVTTHMFYDPATGAGVILLANRLVGSALLIIRSRLLEEAPNFKRGGTPSGRGWGRGGVSGSDAFPVQITSEGSYARTR